MLDQTITHYAPWDEPDAAAYCGAPVIATTRHSLTPSCPTCAARLDAEDAAFEATPLPLDAEEAHIALDPVLNAGLPARAPLSPLGAELFALANTLALLYAVKEVTR